MRVGFLMGALTEVTLIRPVGRRSPFAVFVVSIALFLALNSRAPSIWGAPPQEIIPSLSRSKPTDFARIFGAVWRYKAMGTLLVALVLTGLLFLLFGKTKFGLATRGAAR